MEAMATELVCVAAKNRGTDDLLEGSKLRFQATDVSDLKEKLKMALTEDCSTEVERNLAHLSDYDIKNALTEVKHIYLGE